MAVTRLSDAIVPAVFNQYMLKETMVMANIFRSGAIRMDAEMGRLLSGGGRLFNAPFWNDLDNTESGIGSDDPAVVATPAKIGASKYQFIRQFRTRGWSSANLVSELAGDNPQRRIVSRVAEYWARDFDRRVVSTLNGVFNNNIANNSGDMVYDATGLTGTTTIGGVTTNAYSLNASVILEAKQTMGDRADFLKLLIMHSRLYTNLQKQNLIAYIPNARGEITLPTYLGYQVLVSDRCPAVVASGHTTYTTYLLADGALGFAESPPERPVETFYWPAQGNGAGVEELWTRRQFALHPYGHTWNDASVAGQFPTNTEIELAANWTRAFPERKQVPMAAILTKDG